MDKKIVVLVHPGLPYRKTIRYARERARDMGAKILLLSAIPEFDETERVALAMHEFAPYDTLSRNIENDMVAFLERVVQFCLDNDITANMHIEKGGMEDVIKRVVKDTNIRLVVVPTPTKEAHHTVFIDTIREFAHNMLEHELRCPVISVLAT